MKGDIAQRSIRSSMSRIAEARLPRTISSVMGSTRGTAVSGMGALQEDVVGRVHAGPEAGGDQRRGVVLLDDRRALPGHAGREGAAGVAGGGDETRAAEVDRPVAGQRVGEPARGRAGGSALAM